MKKLVRVLSIFAGWFIMFGWAVSAENISLSQFKRPVLGWFGRILLLTFCTLLLTTNVNATPAVATFVVDTTGDEGDLSLIDGACLTTSGTCSLRAAIEQANHLSNTDKIHFAISGSGPHTIDLTTQLPEITASVHIDGSTQTGAQCPTASSPADLRVTVTGIAQAWKGLILTPDASNSSIKGMILDNFDEAIGILADDVDIFCNQIGVLDDGNEGEGNSHGIRVYRELVSDPIPTNIQIGSPLARNRNVVGGEGTYHILINHGTTVNIQGNYIGTNAGGTTSTEEGVRGVDVRADASEVFVGGFDPSEGNLISGVREGVRLLSTGTSVYNNLIGTDRNGTGEIGNTFGILIETVDAQDNIIGRPSDGNTIAFNTFGVWFSSSAGTGNSVRGNAIFENVVLGIDLSDGVTSGVTANDEDDTDVGPNNLQNYPALFQAESNGTITAVMSGAPNTELTIDFYLSTACDSSAFGEGETWLDSTTITTDATGLHSFTYNLGGLPLGNFVTATATDPDNNTSEFSNCSTVTEKTFMVSVSGDESDGDILDGECDIVGISTACTLRAAIEQINALTGGPYRIEFDTSARQTVIRPNTNLPPITTPVVIDGLVDGNGVCPQVNAPATLSVVLNGADLTTGHGIELDPGSDGSIIQGVVILNAPTHGIRIDSNENQVLCSHIGVGINGTTVAANGGDGIFVGGDSNLIGGDFETARNVLSGNMGSGVELGSGANDNKVRGNIIGISADGNTLVPNQTSGIEIDDATNNVIGGTTIEKRNIISGNNGPGVDIRDGSSGNFLRNNYIGTNLLGDGVRPNTGAGVRIREASTDNVVGGVGIDDTWGNIISGNDGNGVLVNGNSADNTIRLNTIGVTADGSPRGNGLNGVSLQETTGNLINDNTIHNSGDDGVVVEGETSTGNRIRRNLFANNGGIDIDLGDDGVTSNDSLDLDMGPNELQNYATITAIDVETGDITAEIFGIGRFDYNIDFYLDSDCSVNRMAIDTYLGTYSLDATIGINTFTANFPELTTGDAVVTTATNLSTQSTSEFSPCVPVEVPSSISLVNVNAGVVSAELIPTLAFFLLLSTTFALLRPLHYQRLAATRHRQE